MVSLDEFTPDCDSVRSHEACAVSLGHRAQRERLRSRIVLDIGLRQILDCHGFSVAAVWGLDEAIRTELLPGPAQGVSDGANRFRKIHLIARDLAWIDSNLEIELAAELNYLCS